MDVMIDLETLGTRPDAAIIQIGAVFFEPLSGGKVMNGKGFNRHVLVCDNGGTIDHGTLCFWLAEKSSGAMAEAMSTKADFLGRVLQEFTDWPAKQLDRDWEGIGSVWASPSDFDLPILKSAFARAGMSVPWDRRTTRDAHTLFALAGGKPEIDQTGFTEHDAFDDAVVQAMQVQKAMGVLAA